MTNDPTDAEREALARLIAAELFDDRVTAEDCTDIADAILSAGYRSPASLLRAWEMGRDAAATRIEPSPDLTDDDLTEWGMDYRRLGRKIRALTPPPDLMQSAGEPKPDLRYANARLALQRAALRLSVCADRVRECGNCNGAHDADEVDEWATEARRFAGPHEGMQRGLAGDMGAPASAPGELGTSSGERRAPASPRPDFREVDLDMIEAAAYTRGAEAMRDACAKLVEGYAFRRFAEILRSLPVPEEGGDA